MLYDQFRLINNRFHNYNPNHKIARYSQSKPQNPSTNFNQYKKLTFLQQQDEIQKIFKDKLTRMRSNKSFRKINPTATTTTTTTATANNSNNTSRYNVQIGKTPAVTNRTDVRENESKNLGNQKYMSSQVSIQLSKGQKSQKAIMSPEIVVNCGKQQMSTLITKNGNDRKNQKLVLQNNDKQKNSIKKQVQQKQNVINSNSNNAPKTKKRNIYEIESNQKIRFQFKTANNSFYKQKNNNQAKIGAGQKYNKKQKKLRNTAYLDD